MVHLAVIGAGVMGLSCARLAIQHPGVTSVSLYAKDFTPNVTSDGAGALWRPVFLGDVPPETGHRWCKDTFDFCMELIRNGKQDETGAFVASGYDLHGEAVPDPIWKDIVFGFRHVPKSELEAMGGRLWTGAKTAWFYSSIMIDPSLLLQYLSRDCQARGVTMIQQQVNDLNTLLTSHDVVINCTGLGARKLVHDPDLKPARGVTVHVAAPWIKQFVLSSDMPEYEESEFAHIFPRMNVAVVGGVKQVGNEEPKTNPEEVKSILQRAAGLDPSIVKADIVNTWVGFRPMRSSVQLKMESRPTPDGTKRPKFIIHNYGHGGSGLTIWQGCANDVYRLLDTALKTKSRL